MNTRISENGRRQDACGYEAVYNRYEVMQRFEYDLGAFEELVQLFRSCCPEDLDLLNAAVEQRDPKSVGRITKRFKDAAKSFSCDTVSDSVRRLEEAVERGVDVTDSKDLFARLSDDLDVLQHALDEALGNE